ncbi:SIR2 family protein [Desulfospira joergensenii]|uniref:SIR2 family protein n=1 Tax=Desulfospira joergensenii TaxID=53329 RepID=UPI0003B32651|nr:SIR2 family protein [Desulfospira joergensenii]
MKAKDLFADGGDLVHKLRSESDIIRHIQTREGETANYSLFLGAGASINSGIRTAHQLIKEWLFELFERFNHTLPKDTYEAIEYFKKEHSNWYNSINPYSSLFEKKYDLPSQRRRFIEKEVDQRVPSIGYAYLVSLVDKHFFSTIFTTNFDDLVNEAFYQFSNNRPIYCAHDSSIHSISITSKRPKILKLHGDYLFDDIKSTLKETESLEQNTKEKLIEFCKEFGLIVIGYSGNDRSVMDVLEFLTKQDNYLKNGIYWCFREEDHISRVLRNLLWKDKVYPVLIDGFDEFLARAYNDLIGGGLDIESNIKQSKLQKTINNITKDKYNLSKNNFIKEEIELIKNSNRKNDISNFINDISKDNDSDLPLSDLRNLLEIEDLINKKNFQGAYDLCEAYYQNSQKNNSKSKYASKMVSISLYLNNNQLSLNWSDRLIELDRHNVVYNLKKANSIFDLRKRYEYIHGLIDAFSYRYEIYNETAKTGYMLFKNDPVYSAVNLNDLLLLLEKSLKLHPSLSNIAWNYKLDILEYKCEKVKDKTEYEKRIKNHIKNAVNINPKDFNALNLRVSQGIAKKNFQNSKDLIKEIYQLKSKCSKLKRNSLNELINEIMVSLPDFPNNNGYKSLSKDFYEIHLKDIDINENSGLLISKGLYFINIQQNLKMAEKYFLKVISTPKPFTAFDELIKVSMALGKNNFEKIDKLLEDEKYKITPQFYSKCKSEICMQLKDYSKSKKFIKKAYDMGLSIVSYLTELSYIYLRAKEYEKVLEMYSLHNDVINQLDNV